MMSLPKPYYEHGGITIYHGDCREIVPFLPSVGLIITDPPFSQNTHKNAKSNRGKGHGNTAIDFPAIDFPAIESLFKVLGEKCDRWLVSFLDWRHIHPLESTPVEPWNFVRFGVWVKTNPMPQISADRPANGWDGIAYLHNSKGKMRWNGGGSHGNYIGPVITDGLHPTAKPLNFMLSLVERFSDPGDVILDPFAGSGTTLRAAKDLGRKAIGIEIDRKYCDVAIRRLAQEVLIAA